MTRQVVAPFSKRQVRSLNGYQRSGLLPVMCPREAHGPLVAGAKGWRCETCTHRSGIALSWMADFGWRRTDAREAAR